MNPTLQAKAPVSSAEATATTRWGVVALLFIAILVNYIDRGNLSVAAVSLMGELELSPTAMGALLSSFFWTYTLLQIPSGWIVDRFGIKWTYAAAFALWSVSSAAVGWAAAFWQIFALRLLLGVGEAVAQPVSLAYIRSHFREEEQGLPTGLYLSGMMIGPAVGLSLGGFLLERLGWRELFIITGLGALVWLLPWLLWAPSARKPASAEQPREKLPEAASAPVATLGLGGLLRSRIVWGITIGTLFYSYYWYFVITWLPSYLVMERGFSFEKMGAFTGGPLLAMALVTPIGGRLADRWIARTGRPLKVRKFFFCIGVMLGSSLLLLRTVESNGAVLGVLVFALAGLGLAAANFWALLQTVSPVSFAGRAVGYQNTVANLSGICAPILTGYLVGETKNFQLAILFAAGALWVAAAAYAFLVREQDAEALKRALDGAPRLTRGVPGEI
jgi:MFS transporter, ACS family, D-galactonate transporter